MTWSSLSSAIRMRSAFMVPEISISQSRQKVLAKREGEVHYGTFPIRAAFLPPGTATLGFPRGLVGGTMRDMSGGRDITILLVEPDPADARRATAILKRGKGRHHVTVATDASQALEHLHREAHHYRSPRPGLILLSADNLPGRGEDLLTAIKCDPKLAHIPVIFMRASGTDSEVSRMYDLDANCYIQK